MQRLLLSRSWMKPQGARAPGGPWGEVCQAGGSAEWLQASRTVGLLGSCPWWKSTTLSCAPPTAALLPWPCKQDGCHRYSKFISCNCAGRPCLSTVCSWVTAHTYFSGVSNGNKWTPLWLDVMYEGVRVSAWSASQCCGANQGSDGYSDYLPQNVQLQLSKNFLAQLTGFTNLKFSAWLLKNTWKKTLWREWMRHQCAGLAHLSNGHMATAARECQPRAGPWIWAGGGIVCCSHTLPWSTLPRLTFVNGKQGWWRKPNRDTDQAEIN